MPTSYKHGQWVWSRNDLCKIKYSNLESRTPQSTQRDLEWVYGRVSLFDDSAVCQRAFLRIPRSLLDDGIRMTWVFVTDLLPLDKDEELVVLLSDAVPPCIDYADGS